jgi:WhiB family redox-sensing transcriptional regulator
MSGWTVLPDAYGTVRTLRGFQAANFASHAPASDDEIAEAFALDPRGTQPDRPACAGEDPELFFPEQGDSVTAAKRICAGCPLRTGCLEFAMEHGIRFGVWGGTCEADRRELRIARHKRQVAA